MNRWRSERRRRALTWAAAGTGAGVVVTLGAVLIGVPVLGALAGGVLIAGGLVKALETANALPPMTREHHREHLELADAAGRMIREVRMLPEMADQIGDLVEMDAVMRGQASAAVARIQSLYDRAAREGRIGVMDRLKGGIATVTGADPINELEFMGRTVRSYLDREIATLSEGIAGERDANVRAEREHTLTLLKSQREAFDNQVVTLRKLNGSLRKVSESIRTMELQAANLEASRLEPMRVIVDELARSVGADMEALDRAMAELSGGQKRIDQR